jgi:hypothetical protein
MWFIGAHSKLETIVELRFSGFGLDWNSPERDLSPTFDCSLHCRDRHSLWFSSVNLSMIFRSALHRAATTAVQTYVKKAVYETIVIDARHV